MSLRLHDETTGALRQVELRPRMGVYVCGITPYDSAHLGHAFTYVQFDVLVRYLRHLGADVVHVQNVTDVDDDILRVARERGVEHGKLARSENESFRAAMDALGVLRPTEEPWASSYVPDMIEDVRALLDAGVAYRRGGAVYFRVGADPMYGRLSQLDREEMIRLAAERGGRPDDPLKDDPLDFVLWQPSEEGDPVWESPWGPGRPGWHIECSTMARRIIGVPVDVHGGGEDLVFPHHESEMAQAEHVPGGAPFALHWMHVAMVDQAGEKMSKSGGNLTFVGDLLDRYPAAEIRRFLLSHHYREPWEFREPELAEAARSEEPAPVVPPGRLREEFFAALDHDLDTPAALRILDLAREAPRTEDLVEEAERILGLE